MTKLTNSRSSLDQYLTEPNAKPNLPDVITSSHLEMKMDQSKGVFNSDAGAALQEMRDKHPHAAPPPVPKGETSTEPLAVFSQDV